MTNVNCTGEIVQWYTLSYRSPNSQFRSTNSLEISFRQRAGGFDLWRLTILVGAVASFTSYYLSSGWQEKPIICWEAIWGHDGGIYFCSLALWVVTNLDYIGEAVVTFSTCYVSLRNHPQSIISVGAHLWKRDRGISIWLSTIWAIPNLNFIDRSVVCFTACYLSSWSWLTSITGFQFSLKERDKRFAFWLLIVSTG